MANSYSLANLHSFADLNSFNVALARRYMPARQFALASRHGSATRPRRSAICIAATRSRSMLGDCDRSRRCRHDRISERSFLFTMSDITQRALMTHARSGLAASWRMRKTFFSANEHPGWWSQTGSNRRPPACKAGALPTELWPRTKRRHAPGTADANKMVGLGRLELPTSRLSSARSNQLSYKPELFRPTDRWPHAHDCWRSREHTAKAARGSFAKKEKRRRRCPANRLGHPETTGPDVSKRSDRGRVRRL